jgi:hypothetical protein
MTDLYTAVEKPEYRVESTETELDQDELLWQAKIDELFEQIISWFAPFSGLIECKIIPILINNYEEFWEDHDLPSLPQKTENVLRITFPSGKYAELLPSGPHIIGNNYEEYFAEVNLRMRNRRLVMVMVNKNSSWECAEYFGVYKPLIFTQFDQQTLNSFLL